MVGHQLAPVKGFHFRIPLLFGSRQALVEILETLLEVAGVWGIEFPEFSSDAFGDAATIVGIEPVMRIAERMDVAHGASHRPGGNVENFSKLRSVKISVRADLNPWVAALRDQRRQPPNLQLQSDQYEQIRVKKLQEGTWFRFHKMGILIASGDRFHGDVISAHL